MLDLRTILHLQNISAYCQLICGVNKQKQLDFTQKHRSNNFAYIVFTDKCTVVSNLRVADSVVSEERRSTEEQALVCVAKNDIMCFRARHLVHVWAGISMQGRADICILKVCREWFNINYRCTLNRYYHRL